MSHKCRVSCRSSRFRDSESNAVGLVRTPAGVGPCRPPRGGSMWCMCEEEDPAMEGSRMSPTPPYIMLSRVRTDCV